MYENKKKNEWNHKTIVGRPICLSMLQKTIQIWFQLLSSYKFLPLPVMFLPQCLSLSCLNVPGSFPAVLHPIPCLAWNGFSFNLIMPLPILPLASALIVTFSVKMPVSPSGWFGHSGLCPLWVVILCLLHCRCIFPHCNTAICWHAYLLHSTLSCLEIALSHLFLSPGSGKFLTHIRWSDVFT